MDPRFVDKTRFVDGFLGHEKSTNRVRGGFQEAKCQIYKQDWHSPWDILPKFKGECELIRNNRHFLKNFVSHTLLLKNQSKTIRKFLSPRIGNYFSRKFLALKSKTNQNNSIINYKEKFLQKLVLSKNFVSWFSRYLGNSGFLNLEILMPEIPDFYPWGSGFWIF